MQFTPSTVKIRYKYRKSSKYVTVNVFYTYIYYKYSEKSYNTVVVKTPFNSLRFCQRS